MRILIATAQVPFVRGGAELHAEGLRDALVAAGHAAELVSVPFKWYPPERMLDCMLACRLLDVAESCGSRIDAVIGLKFPAYFIPHPHKIVWVLHQYRGAYDLWGHEYGDLHRFPNGAHVRMAIEMADRSMLAEAHRLFANSKNVAARLRRYCSLESVPLYHPPPGAEFFYCADAEPFFYFPSRLNPLKRQELVLRALEHTKQPVVVYFSGAGDDERYTQSLYDLARRLELNGRVRWLGSVSHQEKVDLYARCSGVIFPPIDEDYGYVSLEAMLSSKALITCSDSGGPLEFVRPEETGLVADPSPESLAAALDLAWADRRQFSKWGKAGRDLYDSLGISWPSVVRTLLS